MEKTPIPKVPEIEILKKKKRDEFQKQAQEIENLQAAAKLLKDQVFQEKSKEIRDLLIPMSQQLDEILKFKVEATKSVK
ncbi:hypothetical protein FQN50_009075, partial [Emmonsiellopsis sp. PD_5]